MVRATLGDVNWDADHVHEPYTDAEIATMEADGEYWVLQKQSELSFASTIKSEIAEKLELETVAQNEMLSAFSESLRKSELVAKPRHQAEIAESRVILRELEKICNELRRKMNRLNESL